MLYIKKNSAENGTHGNPQDLPFPGSVELPESLLGDYLATMGFSILHLTEDEERVTAVTVNQEALDAYLEYHPDVPPPEPEPSADEILDTLLGV